MIGLDTNILVRYLVQDDPHQAKKATELIEGQIAKKMKMVIHPVVLCELVCVLERAYHFTRKQVVPVLEKILRTSQFEFPEKDTLWEAWKDYESEKGDFADFVIGRSNERWGASQTVTFDQNLKGKKQFQVLGT